MLSFFSSLIKWVIQSSAIYNLFLKERWEEERGRGEGRRWGERGSRGEKGDGEVGKGCCEKRGVISGREGNKDEGG